MATHIAFSSAMDGIVPVVAGVPSAAETITATGTSAQSTVVAQKGNVCTISTDADVYVAFGLNPTATAAGHRVMANQSRDFGRLEAGWKVAVITV